MNYSKVFSNDTVNNANSTDFTDIGINATNPPIAPVITSLSISPSSPTTSQDLTCSATVTDANNDSLTLNFTWYNSTNYSVVVLSELKNISAGGTNTSLITSGNTSVRQVWNCSVFANDGIYNSSLNSTTVTIVACFIF